MIEILKTNLIHTGFAMSIFGALYVSNMIFGLFYNIKMNGMSFDKSRILNSVIKVLVIVLGSALLVCGFTFLPILATELGWTIPEEYSEFFADTAIAVLALTCALPYAKDAFEKLKNILTGTVVSPISKDGI